MLHETFTIELPYEELGIKQQGSATITTYIKDVFPNDQDPFKRPLIVICPGGGYAMTSDREAEALAVTISALLLMPEAVEALKQMILVAWAGGESVMDLRCLLDGRKVPLVKSADKWVVSLSQLPLLLTDGGSVRGNDSGEGVGYSDYIRMFLFLKSVPEITMRTLDCVEEALHSKHILFQADQCVTKLEIQNKITVYKNLNYQYPVYFGYE